MPKRGFIFSEESKQKMRLSHIGHIPWNKGKKLSSEHCKKLSLSHIGQEAWNKGKKLSLEHCNKLSISLKGRKPPKTAFKKGGHYSLDTEIKKGNHYSLSTEFKKGELVKEKHPNWRGGISKQPYPFDFSEELKILIRKRDNYKCKICGVPQEECIKTLHVHHIDYNKENINPNNLITLCNSCHSKTTVSNRENWKEKLKC